MLYQTVEQREDSGTFPGAIPYVVPSFAGLEVCQYADSIIMDDGQDFPFVINHLAAVGESWLATIQNGNEVIGRVDSQELMSIFGEDEQVKYINFYVGSSNLLEAPILLSEHHGLLRAAYFWDITNRGSTLEQLNYQEGVTSYFIPDRADIFALQVGTEYHVLEEFFYYLADEVETIKTIDRIIESNDLGSALALTLERDRLSYISTIYQDPIVSYDTVFFADSLFYDTLDKPDWLAEQPGALVPFEGEFGVDLSAVVILDEDCGLVGKGQNYPIVASDLYDFGERALKEGVLNLPVESTPGVLTICAKFCR